MSTTTYLITGASRGLGLGYARELLRSSPSVRVVGACRDPDSAHLLKELKDEFNDRLMLLKCDVGDEESTK
ncbi:hypothetical protein JCM10212_004191, partial [Sporobolomyces blumeae]